MKFQASVRRQIVRSAVRGELSAADAARPLWFIALIWLATFVSAAAQSSSPAFTAINVTGAGTGTHEGTAATAIDAAGDVAGIYIDASDNEHAFVLPFGGSITPFDASGTGGKNYETIPIGFDSLGDAAGIYLQPYTFLNGGETESSHHVHGFLRTASTGAITIIDVTGEDTGENEGTFPICINASGAIAGDYSTTSTTASGTNSFTHGFVRSAGGTITTFDAEPLPATYGSTNPGTLVLAMNASGEVAGFYIDGVGAEHGFLRDASGNITTINPTNAATGSEQGTIVTGIDAAGDVIGAYTDSTNVIHGFVRNASTGTVTVIDAPGAGTLTYQGTYPDAIDAAGDISGSFTDANNVVHGFVLPANGTISTYDAPGAITSAAVRSTANSKLSSELRQLGKSFGLSHKSIKSNSPLMKLRGVLGKVGAVTSEGTGLLNGNGPNPSGTASYGNLLLNSVNASGEIVGIFTDGNYVFQGYVRATNGTITAISDSGAGTAAEQGTGALAINDSGVIAGTYADSNSVLHGFIYDSSTLTATATTLTPVPTPNPSVYQEPVTLTATVSSGGGTPPNGENVTFMSGTTSLGTAALTSGAATLATTNLPTGTDSITAVYGGDSTFSGSTSTAVSQTVNKASSSTSLTSSLNPSISGQSVILTANISGQFSGVATGTVAFSDGGTSLGSSPVSSDMATLTTTTLPVGTDSITAVYSGDSNFTGSTASALSQVVNPVPGFAAPSGSQPGSISIQPGATTNNTATISVVGTNGFSGTVNLTCTIAPVAAIDPPTCSLSPPSVTLSGTTTQTSTLTVASTGATSALIRPVWQQVGGIAFAVVLMFAVPRRRRGWLALLVALAFVASIGLAGCGGKSSGGGGGGNSGTSAGTYTVTVTGTSGTTTATITTVSLTVQ